MLDNKLVIDIQKLRETVANKFGELIAVKKDKIIVKRARPTWDDKPYMTISVMEYESNYSFYWGHYDLSLGAAAKIVGV